ncbi:MAG: NAD(P)-binding domain-containing protein [Eubacterium sp.]|nr:NAD(P)-binding domain-containing protein [Eubacterium sp.]
MIQNIAVIGAGTMGHGIAHVFARSGRKVTLYDPIEESLLAAPEKMREELQFMADADYIPQEDVERTLGNIIICPNLAEAVKDADYVMEAIPECMELKKALFAQLDTLCPRHTVFATNTSSLKLSEMIADLPAERQKRCMVSHWYNPAYLIPIAELSKFGNMDEEVFDEVYALYEESGKQPVRVLKDIPGMIANRILHAQAREVFHLLDIGAASYEDIDKALMYGPCFRNATTGMLETADMGGLDVWCAAEDNMFPHFNNSDKASDSMRSLVAEGHYGIKTGKGFFEYPESEREEVQQAFYDRLIRQLKVSETYKK